MENRGMKNPNPTELDDGTLNMVVAALVHQ